MGKRYRERGPRESITIGELIEMLQKFDEELEVQFSYDYGDRANMQICQGINGVEERKVAYSSYLSDNALVEEGEEDQEDPESLRTFVIIT